MGSVIGDYIHLHRGNYYTYGIEKRVEQSYNNKVEDDAVDYSTMFKNYTRNRALHIKMQIKADNGEISLRALKELELVLNAFKAKSLKNGEGYKKAYEMIIDNALNDSTQDKRLLELIQKEANRQALESRFDITTQGSLELEGYSAMASIDLNKDLTKAYKKLLILRHYLCDLCITYANKYSTKSSEYQSVTDAFTKVGEVLDEIQSSVPDEARKAMLDDVRNNGGVKLLKGYKKAGQTVKDFILGKGEKGSSAYNALMESFAIIDVYIEKYMSALAISNTKGLFFEKIAQATPTIAKIVANNEITGRFTSVTNGITGQTGAMTYYNLDKFRYGHTIPSIVGGGSYDFGTADYKLNASVDGKIDAQLNWTSKEGDQKSLLSMSIKNIKGTNFITTVSGTPLLFYLQNEAPWFVNHFLNIFSYQLLENNDKTKVTESGNFIKNKMTMQLCIRILFVLMGLTGAVYRRQSANVFLINDNSQVNNGIRVIAMDTIIDNVIDILNNETNIHYIGNVFSNGSIKAPFKNKYVEGHGGEKKRISQLWRQLHMQKITTGINQGLLKNK